MDYPDYGRANRTAAIYMREVITRLKTHELSNAALTHRCVVHSLIRI